MGGPRARLYVLLISLASLLVAALRWFTRARVADDYDSMNFLLGMSRYDLSKFQPQFPGYPVFMALGTALHRLGLAPLTAAVAISCLAAGASTLGLASIAWRLAGPRAALASIPLQAVAWLPWLLGSGALSDSLGVSLAIASFALVIAETPHPLLGGIAGALMLGVRLSYWPLALSLLVVVLLRQRQVAFAAGFGAGLAAWLVPFVAVVGMKNLMHLGRVHVAGHFGQWGGSVVTKPNLWRRAGAFARDIFYDGLAPSVWALAAIAVVVVALSILERDRLRALPWRPVLLVLAPYALWAFFAQNILEQPRHVLPLVEGLLLLLAMVLCSSNLAQVAVFALMLVVSGRLALERDAVPPAAAQAADWLATHQTAGDTLVAGTRSVRFFQAEADRVSPPPFQVREDPWLSGLIGELARVDRLPSALWVTSEVDLHSGAGDTAPLPSQWQLDPGPTFCRDARIDRFQPCLLLLQLTWRPH